MKREYSECFRCGTPIVRYAGAAWEHTKEVGLDRSHRPEPADTMYETPEHQERLSKVVESYRTEGLWELPPGRGRSGISESVNPEERFL